MKEASEELHFHPRWFETQFLPEKFFAQLLGEFRQDKANDEAGWQCSEHYRYRAFRTILICFTGFADEQIDQYLELCDLDEDVAMASAARGDLLLWEGLSREQYQKLTCHPAYVTPFARKVIWRNEMWEALQAETISQELFSSIRSQQDSALERSLVEHPGISIEQLVVLFEQGHGRTVRNMARNRLGRKFLRNRQNFQNAIQNK